VAEKKIKRKELLGEPDEFITASGRAVEFVRENPRLVVIGAALVAVCVVVGLAVYGHLQYKKELSHELFQNAYEGYKRATLSKDQPSTDQWKKLFNEFDVICRDYPSQLAGERALLYSGHVLYKMEDFKGALGRYTRMKSTNLVENGLGSLVLYHLAMTRLAMKDYEPAKELFERLTKDTRSPYRREAYASIGAIYEAQNKRKEAVQAYRQYLKMFPKAPDAAYVKARIAALSAQG